LGLPAPRPFGHFLTVQLENEITLDFIETDEEFDLQHYAFLVNEEDFDDIFRRINERGLQFWADPLHRRANEINTDEGGRGF
jgi:extradiol dioxygenase family protein